MDRGVDTLMFGQAMMMHEVVGGGAPFDPATALVWLDPSDLSTLWRDVSGTIQVTADGQAVHRIDNKGTAGGYLAMSAGNGDVYRPLYKTSGGLHWLQSDGVNDMLVTASRFGLGADPDLTVVIGLRILSNKSVDDRFWELGGPKGTPCLAGGSGTDGWGWRYNGGATLFGANDIGVDHVGTWRRGAGDTYGAARFFLDGVEKSVASSVNPTLLPTAATDNFSIHAESTGSGPNAGNHRNYGLILMNTDTNAMQAGAEAWMATKIGI